MHGKKYEMCPMPGATKKYGWCHIKEIAVRLRTYKPLDTRGQKQSITLYRKIVTNYNYIFFLENVMNYNCIVLLENVMNYNYIVFLKM